MRLLFAEDELVASWAAQHLGVRFIPPFTCLGVVDDDGVLVGAIVFNGFNGFNIEATVYGPACAKRGILRAVLNYTFKQLGCLRLTCRTKLRNKHISRQLTRLGFKYEGTLKNYFGPDRGDSAVVYALFPQNAAKWLNVAPDLAAPDV